MILVDYVVEWRAPLAEMIVTSRFGARVSPITGRPEGHPGVDLRAAEGTPVYAAADGIVRRSYYSTGDASRGLLGYGNRVVIEHPRGYESSYAHLLRRMVVAGDEIEAGDLIGYAGSTGASTGQHLHWEVRRDGSPIDPMSLVAQGDKP